MESKYQISKLVAEQNIEEIVNQEGVKKSNYIYINNKFITQQLLLYDDKRIITFFTRINHINNKLKKYDLQLKFLSFKTDLFLGLIQSRLEKVVYFVNTFEDIALIDNDSQIFFIDEYGSHYFKISKTNIYGFDQTEQISRFKKYVDKIYASIKKK